MTGEKVYRCNDYLLQGAKELKKKRVETVLSLDKLLKVSHRMLPYGEQLRRLSLYSMNYEDLKNKQELHNSVFSKLSSEYIRILRIGLFKHPISSVDASGRLSVACSSF